MKPFEASAKKLRDAKKKGDVARSKEFTLCFAFAGFALWLVGFGENLVLDFSDPQLDVPLMFTSLVAVMAGAVVGEVLQVGPSFNFGLVKIDFTKMNPAKNLKPEWQKFLKPVLFIILGLGSAPVAGYFLLHTELSPSKVLFIAGLVYLCWSVPVAALDRLWTVKKYKKRMRMDATEMKKEFKESEGSPEMKQARKDNYAQLLQNSVRSAKVVLVSE